MFGCWYAFLEGTITRRQLQDATVLIRARMKRYCLKYQASADDQVRTRAKRTLKNWPHLFTFMFYEGVQPTNNPAESALRPSVQWRKLCFGNQSEAGERFTERILTVTRTCQLRGINPFHFFLSVDGCCFQGAPETLPAGLIIAPPGERLPVPERSIHPPALPFCYAIVITAWYGEIMRERGKCRYDGLTFWIK